MIPFLGIVAAFSLFACLFLVGNKSLLEDENETLRTALRRRDEPSQSNTGEVDNRANEWVDEEEEARKAEKKANRRKRAKKAKLGDTPTCYAWIDSDEDD